MRYQRHIHKSNRRMMWTNIALGAAVLIIALGFLYLSSRTK